MKIGLTEIAEATGVSIEAIRKRAQKENWPSLKMGDGKLGRNKNTFLIENLPLDLRIKVLQRFHSDYVKNDILPLRDDLTVSECQALLTRWNEAPHWQRRIAEARLAVLKSLDTYKKWSKGGKLRRFSSDFNVHDSKLGLPPETFDALKTISRSSLYNFRKEWRNFGLVGLLPGGKGKPAPVGTAEMRDFVEGLLGHNPDIRTARVCDYLAAQFDHSGLPSRKTISRWMQDYKSLHRSAYDFYRNPDRWRSDYLISLGSESAKADHYLHMLEFDSSPADVKCNDHHRYSIIGGIDIFSRKAKILVSRTSKSTAIKSLMRAILLDWGLFEVAITDQGHDYVSGDLLVVSHGLSIQLWPQPPFSPEKKPFIERFFGSLSLGLFEELQGFIGHNVAQRKAIESRKSFAQRFGKKGEVIELALSPEKLQELIDQWIERIYHQRIHRSLGKSPEAKAAESTRPIRKIPDPRLLDLLLAPAGFPTVQKKGIRFQNAFYIAPELGDYVKSKVEIRRDLSDAGRVYVFDLSRKFICVAEDASISGLTVDDFVAARVAQRQKVQAEVKAMKALGERIKDPMADLLESKRRAPGQIQAFHRTEEATSEFLSEAKKALEAADQGTHGTSAPATPSTGVENPKIVQISAKKPAFFTSFLERYKYIIGQERIRELTPRELDFKADYEATEEYWLIFIAGRGGKK